MKIAFITASVSRNAGGIFDIVRRLAQCIYSEQKIDVSVIALRDEFTDEDIKLWEPLKPLTYPVIGPRSFGYSSELSRALNNIDADLMHSQGLWMYTSIACGKWAKLTKKKYIITPQGMLESWALKNSRLKKKIAGWLYENYNLRNAICLHAVSKEEVKSFRSYGLKNPICIIPNGVDMPDDIIPTNKPPWEHIIEPEKKVLLYLGRLHPKKNLDNLLRAWYITKRGGSKKINDWMLIIVGWDQLGYEAYLKKIAKELGIADMVYFLGPQFGDAKTLCFQYADAFILPSYSEGMPMAVLEAWSYALPLLMTPECNIPLGFEKNSAIKIKTDAIDIARGLNELFSMSDEERRNIGINGKKLVKENFSWSKISQQMREVYEWILGESSKPECVITD